MASWWGLVDNIVPLLDDAGNLIARTGFADDFAKALYRQRQIGGLSRTIGQYSDLMNKADDIKVAANVLQNNWGDDLIKNVELISKEQVPYLKKALEQSKQVMTIPLTGGEELVLDGVSGVGGQLGRGLGVFANRMQALEPFAHAAAKEAVGGLLLSGGIGLGLYGVNKLMNGGNQQQRMNQLTPEEQMQLQQALYEQGYQ